jgi:hypothetical protein
VKEINWKSTKFLQSAFVQVTGAIALFMDKIDGGTYVALSSLALTIYAVADVAQNRISDKHTEAME